MAISQRIEREDLPELESALLKELDEFESARAEISDPKIGRKGAHGKKDA